MLFFQKKICSNNNILTNSIHLTNSQSYTFIHIHSFIFIHIYPDPENPGSLKRLQFTLFVLYAEVFIIENFVDR